MEKDIKQPLKKKSSLINKLKSLPVFKTKKRTIIAIVVLIVLGFFAWQNLKGNKQRIEYQTVRVKRGTIVSSISASGQVYSVGSYNITTSATGIIKEVYVKNGDMIDAGKPIAEIALDQQGLQRKTKAWADYLSYKTALDSAHTKLNSLQSSLFTANKTFVNGAGTQNPVTDDPTYIIQKADWLVAEANYKNQQTVINKAQADLSNAWLSYQQSSEVITAPIAGVIRDLSIYKGAVIAGSSSTGISETSAVSSQKAAAIKTDSYPTIAINLSEIDAPKVKIGNKATLTFDAFPEKTFTGKVVSIDTLGVVSSGVTNYPVTIEMDADFEELLVNMSATANIINAAKTDVLIIPASAIQTREHESYVRIIKNKLPREVLVKTGIASDTDIEVISGINEGDKVITGILTSQSRPGQSVSPFGTRLGTGGGFGGGSALRPGGGNTGSRRQN